MGVLFEKHQEICSRKNTHLMKFPEIDSFVSGENYQELPFTFKVLPILNV